MKKTKENEEPKQPKPKDEAKTKHRIIQMHQQNLFFSGKVEEKEKKNEYMLS